MIFKFNNFITVIENEKIELREKVAVAISINNGKPSNYKMLNKTREITVFKILSYLNLEDKKSYRVIDDIFDFIDLIEILKAYAGKRLEKDTIYKLKQFTAKIAFKNDIPKIKITFNNFKNHLLLDKFECSSLAAKFQKITQRCEAWQEQEA